MYKYPQTHIFQWIEKDDESIRRGEWQQWVEMSERRILLKQQRNDVSGYGRDGREPDLSTKGGGRGRSKFFSGSGAMYGSLIGSPAILLR